MQSYCFFAKQKYLSKRTSEFLTNINQYNLLFAVTSTTRELSRITSYRPSSLTKLAICVPPLVERGWVETTPFANRRHTFFKKSTYFNKIETVFLSQSLLEFVDFAVFSGVLGVGPDGKLSEQPTQTDTKRAAVIAPTNNDNRPSVSTLRGWL